MGDKALKAKVGDRVRLFVGNGGPNMVSSFHVIGEIFERVYGEAGTRYSEHIQTTLVPAGGAAIVEFKVEVPGSYKLVDHSILRAFNKGALGELKVEGPDNKAIYSGRQVESEYHAEGGAAHTAAASAKPAAASSSPASGESLYKTHCVGCHQSEGQGTPGVFPPLAKSDFLMADKSRAIETVVHGRSGAIEVNGKVYNSAMPALGHLSNDEIVQVLNYVRSSWGNQGDPVTVDDVAKIRGQATH